MAWTDAAHQLRGRVELLRRMEPNHWPDFSAAGLAAALSVLVGGGSDWEWRSGFLLGAEAFTRRGGPAAALGPRQHQTHQFRVHVAERLDRLLELVGHGTIVAPGGREGLRPDRTNVLSEGVGTVVPPITHTGLEATVVTHIRFAQPSPCHRKNGAMRP